METRRFDFVILGSCSTAFAAAIRAAELGKSAAMTENRTLGGTGTRRWWHNAALAVHLGLTSRNYRRIGLPKLAD